MEPLWDWAARIELPKSKLKTAHTGFQVRCLAAKSGRIVMTPDTILTAKTPQRPAESAEANAMMRGCRARF
jgi:hypothetical protein